MPVTFSVVPCDRHCCRTCIKDLLQPNLSLINSRIIDRIQIGRTIQGRAFDSSGKITQPCPCSPHPQHTRNEARAQRTNLQEPFTSLQIQIDGTSLRPQYESGELTYCQPMNLLPGYGVQLVSLLHHPACDGRRMTGRRMTREAGRKDSIFRERERHSKRLRKAGILRVFIAWRR